MGGAVALDRNVYMSILELKSWKILDIEFDLIWSENESEFNIPNLQFSNTDFISSQIKIYSKGRKTSNLWASLWRETFRVIVHTMHVPSILNSDQSEVIYGQLASAFNCMIQDNPLELHTKTWRILDSVFSLQWCTDWDCINEDERRYGQNDEKKSIIHVYIKDRQDTELWAVLWHECLHTVINKMPIKPLKDVEHTDEQETIIDQIAVAFNQVMQCNVFPNLSHLVFK